MQCVQYAEILMKLDAIKTQQDSMEKKMNKILCFYCTVENAVELTEKYIRRILGILLDHFNINYNNL